MEIGVQAVHSSLKRVKLGFNRVNLRGHVAKRDCHLNHRAPEGVEPLIRAAKLTSHLRNGLRGDVQLLARLDSDPYVAKPAPLERVGRQRNRGDGFGAAAGQLL